MEKYQFPKIKDEIQFENFTRDLLNLIYQDNSFQLYGRKGQVQDGLDGYSTIHPIFFQCKHKSSPHVKDKKLEEELESELNKAKPKIEEVSNSTESKFLFFTTHPNATKLQDKARVLSTDNIIVEYWGWETIESYLNDLYLSKNRDFFTKYYPELTKVLNASNIPQQLSIKLGKATLIGREKELQGIDEQLKASKTLLVKGIGGIGKSTIAINYLYRHKNEYNYYGFFEGLESFETELEGAFNLKIEEGQDRFNRGLRELINLNGNKLLVIDKVEDIKENQEKLENILELEYYGYRVLLSSRFKIKNVEIYPLLSLSPLDAQKLFLDNYKTDELEKVNQITGYLDYHPLFVELVATTIATMGYTLDEILKKFDYGELAEIKLIDDDGDVVSFNQNLKELFEMQKDSLKDEYLLLLKQLAILPSIDIELNFLNKIFGRKLNGQWDFLLKQGWLIASENGYKLHEVIKHYLLLPENAPSIEDIEIILEYFSIYTNRNDDWIVYLESVAQFLEKFNLKSKEVLEVYFFIGKIYFEKYGDYNRAKKYLLLNEKIWKELKIDYDIEYTYQSLAKIFDKLEKVDDALNYINEALEIFIDKKEEKSTSTCYDDKGSIYWTDARMKNNDSQLLDKALCYYNKSLEISERLNYSHNIAIVFNNISLIYKDKVEYPNSYRFLEKAFALDIDDKKQVAQFYNNRGELYIEEEKYDLAEKDILFSLQMRKNLKLYEYHDDFAESYDNLATIYFKRGEYQEAKIEQDKAIKIWSYNHDDNYGYLVEARERLVLIEKELYNE